MTPPKHSFVRTILPGTGPMLLPGHLVQAVPESPPRTTWEELTSVRSSGNMPPDYQRLRERIERQRQKIETFERDLRLIRDSRSPVKQVKIEGELFEHPLYFPGRSQQPRAIDKMLQRLDERRRELEQGNDDLPRGQDGR